MPKCLLRYLVLFVCAAATAATAARASESFPVVHHEPITVRVLDGRDGKPLAHVRLQMVGGYNQRDLAIELWYGEAVTNDAGEARLPNDMANLPFVRLWATKEKLCQPGGRRGSFNVEQIRVDGFTTPNQCGAATAVTAPGVLTIFVKGSGAAGAALASVANGTPGSETASQPDAALAARGYAADISSEPDPGTADSTATYQEMCYPED